MLKRSLVVNWERLLKLAIHRFERPCLLRSVRLSGNWLSCGRLRDAIKAVFGIDRTWRLGLIGLGNIGRALLHYQGFSSRGFQIVTLFDASPAIIGQTFSGMEVFDIQRLSEKVAELDLDLVVLAVPAHAIDDVTKIVASSGVSGILNFAPVQLKVPPEISVVTVDLGQQLEQLAFQVTCRKKSLESLPPSLTGT